MKHLTLTSWVGFFASASVAVVLSGCATPTRIDPRGTETVTTVSKLDIQDATDAAGELAQSLLEAGVLGRGGKPSTVAVDTFIDSTGEGIDRDEVLKKIRVVLNKAGVSQTMTAIGSGGELQGESAIASKAARERLKDAQVDAFLNDEEAPEAIYPDFALTFKILDNRVRVGLVRQTQQVTYTFQMSLTDVKSGAAVWEEETQITKKGGVWQK
jgi:PBP1b-binding outer membrane lipoprotein LpoB